MKPDKYRSPGLHTEKSADVTRSKWSHIVDEAMRKGREKLSSAEEEKEEPDGQKNKPLPEEEAA